MITRLFLIPENIRRFPQANFNEFAETYGKTMAIPKEDQQALLQLMSEFLKSNEYQNKNSPPTAELSSFHWLVKQMDKRLAEIEKAIDLISDKQI